MSGRSWKIDSHTFNASRFFCWAQHSDNESLVIVLFNGLCFYLDVSDELSPNEDNFSVEDDGVEFLEPDELDELPIVEPITAPKGKPLAEVCCTTHLSENYIKN